MYPQTHFLFSFFVALIFVKLGIFNYKIAFFVALVGMLIDLDHFLNFAIRRQDYSLKDAWNACVVRHFTGRTFIHHYIGFILITALIIFLFYTNKTWFYIIGLGYYSHLLLDYAKINILKIREKMTIKEAGFTTRINKFEVLFDIFLVIGIVLLIL